MHLILYIRLELGLVFAEHYLLEVFICFYGFVHIEVLSLPLILLIFIYSKAPLNADANVFEVVFVQHIMVPLLSVGLLVVDHIGCLKVL